MEETTALFLQLQPPEILVAIELSTFKFPLVSSAIGRRSPEHLGVSSVCRVRDIVEIIVKHV